MTDVDAAALDRLTAYAWPGNLRELQNVIERTVILTSGTILEAETLALHERASGNPPAGEPSTTLADAERQSIRAALAAANGRISGRRGAAERLGVKPTTLHAKMKKLDVTRPSETAKP